MLLALPSWPRSMLWMSTVAAAKTTPRTAEWQLLMPHNRCIWSHRAPRFQWMPFRFYQSWEPTNLNIYTLCFQGENSVPFADSRRVFLIAMHDSKLWRHLIPLISHTPIVWSQICLPILYWTMVSGGGWILWYFQMQLGIYCQCHYSKKEASLVKT
jgi:hypothetical protein